MRKITKMTAAAAVTLLSGAVALNCSKGPSSNGSNDVGGVVSLALTMPSGLTINSVHYVIHSNQATGAPADKAGDINTSNAQAQPSVETSFAPSTLDIVTLTATTTAGEPCSGSSSSPGFTVTSGAVSSVNVQMICGQLVADGGPGSVRVNGTVVDQSDICPVLNSWEVSPITTGPTGTINVSSTSSDGDATDVLTYKWTAVPAPATDPFTNSAAQSTTFNCPGIGNFALTITVDDHHTPTSCQATRTINVACGQCGNGTVDPGEQCDDPTSFMNHTCDPTTCQTIPTVCGNSLVQPGEQCDNAASFANNTCGAPGSANACQNIAVVCGNGLVQPGEQCEPPNTASCDANCQTISPCSVCEDTGSPACGGIQVVAGAGKPFGCSGLTGAAQTACINLHTCLDQHKFCSINATSGTPIDDPTACFCGSLALGACNSATAAQINAAGGQCAAAYFAVYPAGAVDATVSTVISDLFNRAKPVGMANNLYACDVDHTCFGVCM